MHIYDETRNKIISVKSVENTKTYRNAIAQLEVKVSPLISTLKKQINVIEIETMKKIMQLC